MDTEKRVIDHILKTGMLRDGDRVLAGVSGGADSVFLFYVLKSLAQQIKLTYQVIHVHHGIRGAEADRDAGFVEELCRTFNVPCRIVRRDIPGEAKARHLSLEEAGREARREIFSAEAEKMPGTKIALAHHRDDLSETVLFRIARGTGINGLAAMRETDGYIIRPLLILTRAEIEESLRAGGLRHVEDSTNYGDEAVRNRIRHEILPLLEKRVNAGAARHLAELSLRAAEMADYIRQEAEKRYRELKSLSPEGVSLPSQAADFHPCLQKELILEALRSAGCPLRDFGAVHLEALEELLNGREGALLDLPGGFRAEKTAGGISLRRVEGQNRGNEPAAIKEAVTVPPLEDVWETDFDGWHFIFTPDVFPPDPIPENRYTKWLNYDIINGTLAIRTRLPGDFLTVGKDGGRKSISDYFTDHKVPKTERDRIPILFSGREAVWIVGMRIGWSFRVGNRDERVLKVEVFRKGK